MLCDIKELLDYQRNLILEEKNRLCAAKEGPDLNNKVQLENCDNEHQANNNLQQSSDDKENLLESAQIQVHTSPIKNKHLPLTQRLNLSSNEGSVEEKKQAFIDKLVHSESPLSFRSDEQPEHRMLRYGEYSPNNPQLRVTAAPYIGLGEYEHTRKICLQKQRADYLKSLSKVQYELESLNQAEKERTQEHNTYFPNSALQRTRNLPAYRVDQRLTSAQNALLKPDMDKPKSILSNRRTGSPRERLMADLQHSYSPGFMDGFNYQDRSEEIEREKLKRDTYQHELRQQIEEKRRIQSMRDEQERREQDLENRRLEQQLMRMQEEQVIEEQRRSHRDEQIRRHSEDLLRRKQELQARHGFRKHTDSESSASSSLRNTNVASKAVSHYSPPVSRRNPYSFNIPSTSVFADSSSRYNPNPPTPNRYDSYHRKDTLNRMDCLNTYDTHSRFNAFSRYDSLSRIDSLNRQDTLNRIESLNIQDSLNNVQRRHSATQQDLSMLQRSPKLQRRSSSSRFDDSLPIPVLKAHSPVAKELKHSVPFNSSRHGSDAVRKLEDKWQIPAVQKNIINHGDPVRDGQGRNILTQLGAIRMQLQQEQLRMDELLRQRDISQSKAVDFH